MEDTKVAVRYFPQYCISFLFDDWMLLLLETGTDDWQNSLPTGP